MKCCTTLSSQVFLNQMYEFSTWLYMKINAVYLITGNWGRGDVDNKGQVLEILRSNSRKDGSPSYVLTQ